MGKMSKTIEKMSKTARESMVKKPSVSLGIFVLE